MRAQDLPRALAAPELAPLWLITGEEPLVMIESADAIRARARERGYTEREVLNASATWDWYKLIDACQAMSLFGDRKIVELRMSSFRPGPKGSEVLGSLSQMTLDGVILIISMPYDWSVKKLAWYKKLTATAQVVECNPVTAKELPRWFSDRFRLQKQTADDEALQILTDRCEGNLLAARQEVLKLAYEYPEGAHITADMIRDAVSDVSRFDVEGLLDAAMLGDAPKAARIVDSLKSEGTTIPSFFWMITDEIRMACRVRSAMDGKTARDQAMRAAGVFGPQRTTRISAAVRRMSVRKLENALMLAADIDRLSKGLTVSSRNSDVWSELMSLVTFLAR